MNDKKTTIKVSFSIKAVKSSFEHSPIVLGEEDFEVYENNLHEIGKNAAKTFYKNVFDQAQSFANILSHKKPDPSEPCCKEMKLDIESGMKPERYCRHCGTHVTKELREACE